MLRGPLHNKGANGRCEECGESFPCPTNIAYEAVKRETEASDQVHLVLTRDELATIAAALRARGLPSFADRLELVSASDCGPLIERFLNRPAPESLSQAALEVLSIVAYEQPITRAEISHIRATDSSGVIDTLLAPPLD
jgi:chromosome segregation and condensation protein ScpB